MIQFKQHGFEDKRRSHSDKQTGRHHIRHARDHVSWEGRASGCYSTAESSLRSAEEYLWINKDLSERATTVKTALNNIPKYDTNANVASSSPWRMKVLLLLLQVNGKDGKTGYVGKKLILRRKNIRRKTGAAAALMKISNFQAPRVPLLHMTGECPERPYELPIHFLELMEAS